MNWPTMFYVMAAAVALCAAPNRARAEMINFDAASVGALASGWTSAMTHAGGVPKWEVVADSTAPSKPNVLAQLSNDPTDGRFPLAILEKANFKDGELSVRTKAISGHVDQGAGLVWRYRDPNNYYLVRANALEDNVVLYKVERGRRSSIAPKGTPRGNIWSETQGALPGVEHVARHFPGTAVRGLFQRGEIVRSGRRNLHRAGQNRSLDQGRQRNSLR